MPPQAALPTDQREASWDEIITALAQREGVDPALAIAVARKESNLNPRAIGDSGKAVGMFQLHQGAAADTGTKNRLDPLDNITGGVKYLRQLSDQFGGDVEKTLQAYNGGAKWVTEGKVTPQAQAYASEVLAALSKGVRPATGAAAVRPVTPGRASGYDPANAPENVSKLKQAISGLDPRTSEGRVNLASTAASTAVSLFGGPQARVAGWIYRALGPPVAAAVAGGGERAIEQKVGMTPADAPGGLETGAWQGAYEVGGQLFMWPLRRIGRALMASRVAKQAKAGIEAEAHATAEAGREAVTAARDRTQQATEAARMIAQAEAKVARAAQVPALEASARQATAARTAVNVAADAQVAAAKAQARELLAQAELDGADTVRRVTQQYEQLLGAAPSNTATADAVGAVTRTGVRGGPKGAAQVALDIAGKKVAEAAKTGPAVTLAPLQEALEKMRGATYPDGLLGAPAGAVGDATIAARPAGMPAANKALTVAEFSKHLAETQASITEAAIKGETVSQLPKVLGLIQRAPVDAISFADAHKLKGLLDETVSWDRTAKRKLEGITKGIRIALRESMRGNQAYDQATAAYAQLIPLYKEGIGKQIIKYAQTDPDKLLGLFKPKDAIRAESAKKLIIEQAAAGGDAAAGQQAWDAVRSAFTYRNLIAGGVDKMGDRVHTLVTQYPQFAKTMYGDEAGQQVLTNIDTLAKSIAEAKALAESGTAAAKAAGVDMVESTTRSVKAAKAMDLTDISLVKKSVEDKAAEAVADVKAAGAARTRGIEAQGQSAEREVARLAKEANEAVREKTARFKASSLASTRDLAEQGADAVGALAGRMRWFQIRAGLRLMNGASAADIAEWSTYSSENTQRMAKLLKGQLPDRAVALLMRDLAPILNNKSAEQK